MKAYNETWIRNKSLLDQAARWNRQGLLTDEQLGRTRELFPVGFHDANPFVEIGLFIFTLITVGGTYFLLASGLATSFGDLPSFHAFNIGFGLAMGILAHYLISSRQFYRSGVDNALIVGAVSLLLAGLIGFLPDGWPLWVYCLLSLPLLLAAVWYFGDLLLTLAAFVAVVTTVFDATVDLPNGRQLAPFVLMALSVGSYLTVRRFSRRDSLIYWEDCLTLTEWLSLALLLLSCNYYVVREVNGSLLEKPVPEAPPIRLAGLFWTLTFAIPATLLFVGIRQKNRPLLIMAAVGGAAALATWRHFYPLISLEVHLALTGLGLLFLSGWLIRRLRQPRQGFTDLPDEDSPKEFLLDAETIATIQAASPMTPKGVHFGGGNFGGGGSGDRY